MAAMPRYQQIADDLRRRIESREWAPDEALPTEGDLREQYRASRNTVRDAVKLLAVLRLVQTRAGQGTFITKAVVPFVTTLSADPKTDLGGGEESAPHPDLVPEQGRKAWAGMSEVKVLECPPMIAARLGIDDGESVVSRRQEHYIDGAIWSLQASYYPMEWVRLGAARLLEPAGIPEGATQHIAETLDLKQVSYRDVISARLPDAGEQALFNLTHNDTVIEVFRTCFAEDGTPIRVTVTVFPSDRNKIAYDIGTVPDHREEPGKP